MTLTHPLGTIARIWRFPVKSLAAEALERSAVDARGLRGDRRSALFVANAEHARAGKTYRGKENALLHTFTEPAAAVTLAADRSIEIDVKEDGPYFDASPVSIVFDRWITALEDLVYEPIDPLRFRANLYVKAAPGFSFNEDQLVGSLLAIGDVRLRCTSTTKRCVTPSYDIPSGERSERIARAIAVDLENVMGVYCAVTTSGEIAQGDVVRLEAAPA